MQASEQSIDSTVTVLAFPEKSLVFFSGNHLPKWKNIRRFCSERAGLPLPETQQLGSSLPFWEEGLLWSAWKATQEEAHTCGI